MGSSRKTEHAAIDITAPRSELGDCTASSRPRPITTALRWLRHGLDLVRGSTWGVPLLRFCAMMCGLVVLAWIGHSTAAPPGDSPGAPIPLAPGASASLNAPAEPPDAAVGAPTPAVVPSDAGTAPPATSRARASPEDPVYLNQADANDLRRLPGVGAKRADAILTLRRQLGRFHRVEELLRVKGVGRTTLRKWRPLVRLEAPSASAKDADGGPP